MNYLDRVRYRIKEEGIAKTLRYGTYVGLVEMDKIFKDTFMDYKYSGRSLKGNQKTPYKQLGANDTYHTDYSVMPAIFSRVDISPDDVLVDVGCGKGRIINYWLSCKYKNEIIGLELDAEIAEKTASQFSHWDNVKIIAGDAIEHLPAHGTIFYFYNPFMEKQVEQFEKRLIEKIGNNPVKVIYYNPKSIHAFDNGSWDIQHINFERDMGLKRWGRLNKYHDLAIIQRKPGSFEDGNQ